jgi:septation ring formation regulator EzrA
MEMYNALEREMQAKLTAGLNESTPNVPDMLALAKAMLAKYDEAIAMVEKAEPLNPLYDDVARLRMVRAHLREVNPALKAGDVAKARKSYSAFDDKWDSIEDLVKERDVKAYNTIEEGMTNIGLALKPAMPDVNKVQTLVSGVMDEYNKIVAQVTREARGR